MKRTQIIATATSLAIAGLAIATPIAAAQEANATYVGGPQVINEDRPDNVLTGVVFNDVNKNSIHDEDEPGIAGVAVSNGTEIVTTDEQGRYNIAVEPNTTVFITQSSGYQVPVDEDNVAQFFTTTCPRAPLS